jgi:hypothetical protein
MCDVSLARCMCMTQLHYAVQCSLLHSIHSATHRCTVILLTVLKPTLLLLCALLQPLLLALSASEVCTDIYENCLLDAC